MPSRGEQFFEIPENSEVMAKLVEAVPSTWSWVDGRLEAPEALIASGQAIEETGFAVDRFFTIHPTIIGIYDAERNGRRMPDLYGLMVEQKLPGFVWFHEAGYDRGIALDLAKRIAVGFLKKGYRGGWLHFFRDCHDNSKYSNSASCELAFRPWEGAPAFGAEAGPQPARIKIEWASAFYGTEEHVAPIVQACRSLGLREYVPGK